MIQQQDLIRQLNLSEFKGNRDRFLLIQLMLYHEAKAKVIIKRPKVQLPGHVEPISVPVIKPIAEDDDDHHDPQASSSH